MTTIHFGLNSIPDEKVKEFVDAVEKDGSAEASWECTGRTLHQILASQLADKLPQYRFEIGYNYECKAYKE